MKRVYKDKKDITDALDHIKAKVGFISDACERLLDSDPIGEESVFGMHLIFREIQGQIDDVSKEIDDNVYEVKEVVTKNVSAPG